MQQATRMMMAGSVSPLSEISKPSKRKGTRSVSTLTPSQLARKRANDREAQRAIRARTKEHIERLETELEELKERHSRDDTVQELLRRNKALEKELASLRESLGLQSQRHYPSSSYEDNISAASSPLSSRPSPYGQNAAEYQPVGSFGSSYIPTSDPCEPWSAALPCSAPSAVSSPSSSSGHTDDYIPGAAYIPTSVPAGMLGGPVLAHSSLTVLDSLKTECEDIESDSGYSQHAGQHASAPYLPQHHQAWQPVYSVFYPQSPAL